MPINEPIRILSDLHLGHPSSTLEDPEQIAPLLRDTPNVIFNGDSVEIHLVRRREKGLRDAQALKDLCAGAGVQPFFINGNHDPNISNLDHADLAQGAVLATHGDLLFYDISPWNEQASRVMAKAHREALEKMGDDAFEDFEKRLHACKNAALAIEMHDVPLPRGPLAGIAFVLEEFWPPWRPFQIIKCWIETPGRAVALARVFRPRARFIVIGHTHKSGIWRVGPRVIINTGSFMPMAARYAVDVAGSTVSVKAIGRDRKQFVIGKEVARFDATKLQAHEGY